MRTNLRFRFLFVALLATAMFTSANIAFTAQSRASELAEEKVFTDSDTFYTATDQNGTLTAKVAWASAQNTLAWSFQPSPTVAALATGPMDCQAGHMQLPGYHDNHSSIPVDYIWHSSLPGSSFNVDYTLWGSCTFPVQANGLSSVARPC